MSDTECPICLAALEVFKQVINADELFAVSVMDLFVQRASISQCRDLAAWFTHVAEKKTEELH